MPCGPVSDIPESKLMMKKVAIGCGIAALLLAVAVGVGVYWTYSKAKDFVGSLKELGQVTELDRQVTNKASFTPPENGELTAGQLASFVKINEQVEGTLGPRFAALKARYDELDARMKDENRQPSATEGLAALKDLGSMVKDVRTAQVSALNAQGMSLAEYRWIRDETFAAAGIPLLGFNLNAFIEATKSGDTAELQKGMEHQVSEAMEPNAKNKELVEPFTSKLQGWTTLAWMGF
jgi:hypothetical protein